MQDGEYGLNGHHHYLVLIRQGLSIIVWIVGAASGETFKKCQLLENIKGRDEHTTTMEP